MKLSQLILTGLLLTMYQVTIYQAHAKPHQTKKTSHALQVSPTGIGALKFGQPINKRILSKAKFAYPKDANSSCYYVTLNPATTKNGRANVMLIENNKLGLVSVNNNARTVFSHIKIGDNVNQVLKAHHTLPTYEVDKYDTGKGSHYHLIFSLANGNQIDYSMVGGQKMPIYTIAPEQWQAKTKAMLTGKVQSISVGTPSAIALVEGCS